MKKFAVLLLSALLVLSCALACAAGIDVTRRDLNVVKGLDQNVTNVLVLLQDGDVTDTIMIASVNSRTGRSVMTRIDEDLVVDVMKAGQTPLKDVYALGSPKSRGLLVVSAVNNLLGLNINTYIALDLASLPEIAAQIGVLNMPFDEAEAAALGTWVGINELSGEHILSYVRLRLDSDSPARSRGYDALMQLLYQGLHSDRFSDLMGLGTKLLSEMDTNMNVLNAVTMVSAVQGGGDRRELLLPAQEHILTAEPLTADVQAMRDLLHSNLYE